MFESVKYIGFDADDTLWVNESFFRQTEDKYCKLLEKYAPPEIISQELFKTEMNNLPYYGYGIKSFVLSLLENALRISENKIPQEIINKILLLGKELIESPLELIDGVEEVVKLLYRKYPLIVVTKGDLLDQERKLKLSGLENYFHHVEIMSEKKESDYKKLLNHMGIKPREFLMIGNSLRSDILPVLELGGYGVYLPFHTVWAHENVTDHSPDNTRYKEIKTIRELLDIL